MAWTNFVRAASLAVAVAAISRGASGDSKEPAPAAVTAEPGKGVIVDAGDPFAMELRGRIQVRNTVSMQSTTTNEIDVRTFRLVFSGHLLRPELLYFVQLAFGPADFDSTSPSPIFDAYFEYGALRDAKLRVGQYYVPFDRARTMREYGLQLVDRGQCINELNLDRDDGIVVGSQDLFGLGGKLVYAVGIMGGNGKNQPAAEPMGFLYVVRLGVRPFGEFKDDVEGDLDRLPNPRLSVGVAGAVNIHTTRQKSTFGTTLTLGTFDYYHAAADALFKWRGLSVLVEFIYRKAAQANLVDTSGATPQIEWSRSGWGMLFQGGMMLTDHVEVAGRWDRLVAIGNTDPSLIKLATQQGYELGAGASYYVYAHFLKVQADYAFQYGNGAAPANNLFRVQLDGTF